MSSPAITVKFPDHPDGAKILTQEALAFVAELHQRFEGRRRELMAARATRAVEELDFPTSEEMVGPAGWQIRGTPVDLQDRRVEITGPADRKMVINALNAGTKVFMACLEDASSPTGFNVLDAQVNLYDAVRRTIRLEQNGKVYALKDDPAVLKVRPRGWHLLEKHLLVDGEPVAGALVDFGLFFFHNANEQLARGTGPYFYLPKMEHGLEARLWNDIFVLAQERLGLPVGTIKATCLIETLPGAFHAEAILYQLRDHIVGLNCGRWDYIFSFSKVRGAEADAVLPDRAHITMTVPFMRAYCLHVIKVCHAHGAHAMGGMAAQIPVKNDDAANEAAFDKVRADKLREVQDGHDGTWVAHPALVSVAMEVFDEHMPTANQVSRQRDDVNVSRTDLVAASDGPRTMAGLNMNVNVGIGYLAAWLKGRGAVPLHNLMEDAATAEISRAQLWQWRKTAATLDSGETVDDALIGQAFDAELGRLTDELGADAVKEQGYADAAELMREMVLADELADFLTIPAYDRHFSPQ